MAGKGDQIQTRRNDHENGVANRDVWTVDNGHINGSHDRRGRDGRLCPPDAAPTARNDVSLAYAGTIHAAQGMTVDRSMVLVDHAVSRSSPLRGAHQGPRAQRRVRGDRRGGPRRS